MVPESFAITWREKKYYTQFRRRKTLRIPGRMIKQFTKDVISLNAFSVALRIFAGLLLAMTNAMIPSLLLSSLLLPLFLSPFCTYKSIFQIHPRDCRYRMSCVILLLMRDRAPFWVCWCCNLTIPYNGSVLLLFYCFFSSLSNMYCSSTTVLWKN